MFRKRKEIEEGWPSIAGLSYSLAHSVLLSNGYATLNRRLKLAWLASVSPQLAWQTFHSCRGKTNQHETARPTEKEADISWVRRLDSVTSIKRLRSQRSLRSVSSRLAANGKRPGFVHRLVVDNKGNRNDGLKSHLDICLDHLILQVPFGEKKWVAKTEKAVVFRLSSLLFLSEQ